MEWIDWLLHGGQHLTATLALLTALLASGHAVIWKRDSRAAALWVGFIWLVPLVGALLYFILGVNRIKRRAILLRGNLQRYAARQTVEVCSAEQLATVLPAASQHLTSLASATSKLLSRSLLPGNRLEPLFNGDAAYPAMLDAIASAQHSLTLSTYIFDRDEVGLAFARALGVAVKRGVEVRVLIDATGTRYSWPPIPGLLRREGVRYARFLPTFPLWQLLSTNLRNHRKILVADGRIGFTGGLNIRAGHWLAKQPSHPVRDLHFRIEGPVVAHLQEVFADDWFFTTRRSAARREMVSAAGKLWAGHCARHRRRAGRRLREIALDNPGGTDFGAEIGLHRHALLSAGAYHHCRAESGRPARRSRGHFASS